MYVKLEINILELFLCLYYQYMYLQEIDVILIVKPSLMFV